MQHVCLKPSIFLLVRDLSTSSTTAGHICGTWPRLSTHDHPRPGVTPTHTCKFMSESVEIQPSLVVCVFLGEVGGSTGPCLSSVPSSHVLVRNDRGEEEAGW